jgi:hypothetical protein
MKNHILIFILLLVISLSNFAQDNPKTLNQEEFLEAPLGFKETIENFKTKTNVRFKLKKYLNRNKHYPEIADTIYQFRFRKSEIFFIRTHLGKEFLIAGKVENRRIKFVNDIHVGMKKDDFMSRFTNQLVCQNDSVEMIGEGTKYTFIFKRNKLRRINIDNYFD